MEKFIGHPWWKDFALFWWRDGPCYGNPDTNWQIAWAGYCAGRGEQADRPELVPNQN